MEKQVSKSYKVILIINMTVCFIYGVLFGFLWWFWTPLIDYSSSTPYFSQFFGGFLIIGTVWFLRIILQKVPWEKAVYFIQFSLAIMAMMLLYQVYEILFIFSEMSATARTNGIVSTSVVAALLVTNIIFFFTESAKHKE